MSQQSKFETIFSIRYAARLHEREYALWSKIACFFKFMAFMSASAAVYVAIGENQGVTAIIFGVIFIAFQGLEFAIQPTDKKFNALIQKKEFSRLYSERNNLDETMLQRRYDELCGEDEASHFESVEQLAYNDVLNEQGCDKTYAYPNRHQFIALLA